MDTNTSVPNDRNRRYDNGKHTCRTEHTDTEDMTEGYDFRAEYSTEEHHG